jgi:hypothetical protein
MHSIMDPTVGTFAGSIVEPTDVPTEDILPPILPRLLPATEDILPASDNIPVRSALPKKRTWIGATRYVRFVPGAAVGSRSKLKLFDHLVGKLLEMNWHVEAERVRSREVNDQLELGWLL